MAEHAIKTRLDSGPPLILSSDPAAGLLGGAALLPTGVGAPLRLALLNREEPSRVAGHLAGEVAAGIDLLLALTAESTGVGLAAAGMDFRAAAITGAAVDLALEAAEAVSREVVVAGVLGGEWTNTVSEDRMAEELELHAKRLVASGVHVIVARGLSGDLPIERRALPIRLATETGLPTVALLRMEPGPDETLTAWARISSDLGVVAMLFEVPDAEVGRAAFAQTRRVSAKPSSSSAMTVGFQLSAGGSLDEWSKDAKRLVDVGARLIGGGAGTTAAHSATLFRALESHAHGAAATPHEDS